MDQKQKSDTASYTLESWENGPTEPFYDSLGFLSQRLKWLSVGFLFCFVLKITQLGTAPAYTNNLLQWLQGLPA